MTLLSDVGIRRHLELGSVVIDPFRPERLNTDSYDLELGPHFWRYAYAGDRVPQVMPRGVGFEYVDARESPDPVHGPGIWLAAGERVLGHSVEVAGGRVAHDTSDYPNVRDRAVTTHLQATSTAARHGVTACMCAGWGDVGFWNVWVFEIENRNRNQLFLPVGAIIAQVAFTEVEVPSREYGAITGRYQPHDAKDVESVRAAWTPESMLPGPLKVRETWKEVF